MSLTDARNEIRFIREATYGDTEEIFLGVIRSVAVDGKGRVYIADRDHVSIHVYSSDGQYLQSLGRQGQGPGEFDMISPITQIRFKNDKIFVTDGYHMFPHRAHLFRKDDLSYSHSINLRADNKEDIDEGMKQYYPRQIYPREDGSLLVSYSRMHSPNYFESENRTIPYYLHSESGQMKPGPVLEQKDAQFYFTVHRGNQYYARPFEFLSNPLFAVSSGDTLYSAWSADFKVAVHLPDGSPHKIIEHPYEPVPLTEDAVGESIRQCDRGYDEGVCEEMVQNAEKLPDTWPALNDLLVDDENRLWVSTVVEDFDVYEWWVLDETGELITTFEWPRDEPIEVVKNGYMYTRETDNETGLQEVVQYRIEMPEGNR